MGHRRASLAFVVLVAVGIVAAGLFGSAGRTNPFADHVQFSKLRLDPDARNAAGAGAKIRDVAGNRGEPDGSGEATDNGPSPMSYAEEQFIRRAYPLDTIPVSDVVAAQQTWNTYGENKDGSNSGNNANQPFVWDLQGPTHATQPGILSFSGAQYHMAGRVTALALTGACTANSNCRLYVGEAGGGIWRTDNPLSPDPYYTFVSNGFKTNAIGTITVDPNDPTGNTIYVGTGEPNASSDSEAGVGIYKTTDGGNTWTLLPGSAIFATRSISSIAIPVGQPGTLYVGIARGVRGVASVPGGAFSRSGACTQFPTVLSCGDGPDQAPLGLYATHDAGTTFTRIWDGNGTARGVNHVELDPTDQSAVYASAFQQGIWRCAKIDGCDSSSTGLLNFQQIFQPSSPLENTDRTEFALTTVPAGTSGVAAGTRIYAGDGAVGAAFVKLKDGTKVQVGFPSQFWRADGADSLTAAALLATEGDPNARTPSPNTGAGWAKKSTSTDRPRAAPYRETFDYCTGQCWYDNVVYTPKGFPNVVYLLGSFSYNELRIASNARGVLLSTSAGDPDPSCKNCTFSDLTWDDSPPEQPDQTHPDQHAIVTPPGQPFLYFEGSDGGMIRSNGTFDDNSAACLSKYYFGGADSKALCVRLLSRVPHQLYDTLNKGLSTLQFQSVSLDPKDPLHNVQGGTQDNGTFDWESQITQWDEEIYGDGGQSGYNYCNDGIRFNEFFAYFTDENFLKGQPDKWVVTSGPLSSANNGESQPFYMANVQDYTNCGPISSFPQFQTPAAVAENTNPFPGAPATATTSAIPPAPTTLGTFLGFQYAGEQHVWRTVDNGGPEAYLEANCPEFTTSGDSPNCGDWHPLGDPAYTGPGKSTVGDPGDLTSPQYGGDRLLGNVVAVERNPGNNNELWTATSFGRVFVSFNANAVDPASVQFCRIDQLSPAAPPRFVSSIYPDPNNPDRAWLSYDGYNSSTPDTPGHVFEVTFTPASSVTGCPTAATWRDLGVEQGSVSHSDEPGDIPITDLVRDDATGDLYAATDFGVLRGTSADAGATYTWTQAGFNLPFVEVPGLTIDPCARVLYAATHGRSIWRMFLPPVSNNNKSQSTACPRTP